MRYLCALALAMSMSAQETSFSTHYTFDGSGRPLPGPEIIEGRSPGESFRIERQQSINGRVVPVESVEERVISKDATGSVIERVVRRYDPNGQPGPPVKSRIEERKTAAGQTVKSTTWRGDVNGNLQIAERSIAEITRSGGKETAETVVERPTLNGSLEEVERTSSTKVQISGPDEYRETVTSYRQGVNGFYPAVRVTTEHFERNGRTEENSAEYEVGSSGTLQLHSRTITHIVKAPDGSEQIERDLYGQSVPGTVNSSEAALQLQAHQTTERLKNPDGSVKEITAEQRPSISDPHKLGPARVIFEEVCTGKCR